MKCATFHGESIFRNFESKKRKFESPGTLKISKNKEKVGFFSLGDCTTHMSIWLKIDSRDPGSLKTCSEDVFEQIKSYEFFP